MAAIICQPGADGLPQALRPTGHQGDPILQEFIHQASPFLNPYPKIMEEPHFEYLYSKYNLLINFRIGSKLSPPPTSVEAGRGAILRGFLSKLLIYRQ
jgi:hypothetical protein